MQMNHKSQNAIAWYILDLPFLRAALAFYGSVAQFGLLLLSEYMQRAACVFLASLHTNKCWDFHLLP